MTTQISDLTPEQKEGVILALELRRQMRQGHTELREQPGFWNALKLARWADQEGFFVVDGVTLAKRWGTEGVEALKSNFAHAVRRMAGRPAKLDVRGDSITLREQTHEHGLVHSTCRRKGVVWATPNGAERHLYDAPPKARWCALSDQEWSDFVEWCSAHWAEHQQ